MVPSYHNLLSYVEVYSKLGIRESLPIKFSIIDDYISI